MKKSLFALVLGALLTMPCVMYAVEFEIQLTEVTSMGGNFIIPGDHPLDGPELEEPDPLRPRSFRATIDGQSLSVVKLLNTIPSANAIVINAQTGQCVLNRHFITSMTEQISTPGTYILYIQSIVGNTVMGQFVIQ